MPQQVKSKTNNSILSEGVDRQNGELRLSLSSMVSAMATQL